MSVSIERKGEEYAQSRSQHVQRQKPDADPESSVNLGGVLPRRPSFTQPQLHHG